MVLASSSAVRFSLIIFGDFVIAGDGWLSSDIILGRASLSVTFVADLCWSVCNIISSSFPWWIFGNWVLHNYVFVDVGLNINVLCVKWH